jgi:endonuclease/exonuclease/phosphatase family metal-dependent hydrolase
MDALATIIRLYDVVAIQEIRDKSGRAIQELHLRVNETGRRYDLLTGPRVGRSISKEQYAFFYDLETLQLLQDHLTYDDDNDGNGSNDADDSNHPGDLFEREPFMARFQARKGNFDFVLINIHTKPGAAAAEIGTLPQVISAAPALLNELDIICLGDFNADGRYFNEDTYSFIFPASRFGWLIGNHRDTTVGEQDNTYDRIVTTTSLFEDFSGQAGIFRFDEHFDLQMLGLEPKEVSDHYPVWAVFHANRDTD